MQEVKGTHKQPLSKEERIELNQLKEELSKLKAKKQEKKGDESGSGSEDENPKRGGGGYASSSGSGDDEEYLDQVMEPMAPIN